MQLVYFLILLFLAIDLSNASELEHKYAPEITDVIECGPRSSYGKFITKHELFGKKVLVIDYSELSCEDHLTYWGGSSYGHKLIILNEKTHKVIKEKRVQGYKLSANSLELYTKASFDECKGVAWKETLSLDSNGVIKKEKSCY